MNKKNPISIFLDLKSAFERKRRGPRNDGGSRNSLSNKLWAATL
jgi:hypothetical protein